MSLILNTTVLVCVTGSLARIGPIGSDRLARRATGWEDWRMVKFFLGFSTLVWLPYGLYCFAEPSFLGEAAGVVGQSATGTTEIRAMYGGLQAGIGLLCLFALLRRAFIRPALLMLAFLTSCLFISRAAGLVLDGGISGYTAGGLFFELLSASSAITLLARGSTNS